MTSSDTMQHDLRTGDLQTRDGEMPDGETRSHADNTVKPLNLLVIIEDDPDVQFLVQSIFSMDARFSAPWVVDSAEAALTSPPSSEPGIIVLDHGLSGPLPGLAVASLLKEGHPHTKIILFTAHAALQARADKDPSIDAFLLKTEPEKLLPLAQQLTGLGSPGSP